MIAIISETVANHRDRLAVFTSGAGNAAGRINQVLANLPADADTEAEKAALIRAAATALVQKFNDTAQKLGAIPDKAAGIISGQLGQNAATAAAANLP